MMFNQHWVFMEGRMYPEYENKPLSENFIMGCSRGPNNGRFVALFQGMTLEGIIYSKLAICELT